MATHDVPPAQFPGSTLVWGFVFEQLLECLGLGFRQLSSKLERPDLEAVRTLMRQPFWIGAISAGTLDRNAEEHKCCHVVMDVVGD